MTDNLLDQIDDIVTRLIKEQNPVFLGSVDDSGCPNLKAMLTPRKRDGLQRFYLTTNTSSMRVSQYRKNAKACLYFCDPQNFYGIMLTGHIHVLEDADNKAMIWQIGDEIYYPEGVNDPDYCVLSFTAETGRYYHDLKTQAFRIDPL